MYFISKKTNKKMFCGISQVTKYFREGFRNKPQIPWVLVSVFACSCLFSHFLVSFQLLLTANKGSKLSGTLELERYSATSNFLQVCLPKSSDSKLDYCIDISSWSPLMMWERRLLEVSPITLM